MKKIVCFAGWKPFRSAQTITGQWDLGQEGGGAVALGEMDVAGLNPYRFVQGQPLTPSALGLLPTRPANGVHRTPGGGIQRSATYLVGDDHQARIT